jgi:hypothetical protein
VVQFVLFDGQRFRLHPRIIMKTLPALFAITMAFLSNPAWSAQVTVLTNVSVESAELMSKPYVKKVSMGRSGLPMEHQTVPKGTGHFLKVKLSDGSVLESGVFVTDEDPLAFKTSTFTRGAGPDQGIQNLSEIASHYRDNYPSHFEREKSQKAHSELAQLQAELTYLRETREKFDAFILEGGPNSPDSIVGLRRGAVVRLAPSFLLLQPGSGALSGKMADPEDRSGTTR